MLPIVIRITPQEEAVGMREDHSALYAAFQAKDARFDGRFFVGVSSTGIYCRPVCRAKRPRAENCAFYSTAAQAEQAGYRPCLLCRPELAPGSSKTDATASLGYRAQRMLEEQGGSGQSLGEIARRLGCSDRHLRRVFAGEYHVSPVRYLQTCRLLLAKNLLTDTSLPVVEVAMAAGFGSLRRFNDLFKEHYRLSPTELRKQAAQGKDRARDITLLLGYRPPYRWEALLRFLAGRAIAGVEAVRNGEYLRTARFATDGGRQVSGWVRVGHRPEKSALAVTVSESLLPVLPRVLGRVKCLFDLYCEPEAVYEALRGMNGIHPGLCTPGTRVPGCFDAFEVAVRAVLEGQRAGVAANMQTAEVARTYGTPVATGIEGLTHVFPCPEELLAREDPVESLSGALGIAEAQAGTICGLARSLAAGEICLGFQARPEEEMDQLREIGGMEEGLVQYIAMRGMEWPDAFPETDPGIRRALAPLGPGEICAMARGWRPWRSYAAVSLWDSL